MTGLALVFLLASLQAPPSAFPHGGTVIQADSLVGLGAGRDPGSGVWAYAFVQPGGEVPFDDTWVRMKDPFGGDVWLPSLYLIQIGEVAEALIEERSGRSVLFLRRPIAFGLLALMLVSILAAPAAWVRSRFRRERGRRRDAERARHHLAEGREAERLRIARDLHDGPVQHLQVLRLRLATLAQAPLSSATAGAVAADVQAVIRDLRRTSEDLRPPMLGPFGLAAALETLAEQAGRDHPSVAVVADLDPDGQVLPEPVRLALFRIAQEALRNAIRHGRPGRVDLGLQLTPSEARLTVADDGVGFEAPTVSQVAPLDGHHGVIGMAERAETIGARFDLESRPGSGTRLQVVVPLA